MYSFRVSFVFLTESSVRCVRRLFASVQPIGQPAVDVINSYQSVVSLLNTSTQMALAANRTIQDTMSFLSTVDQLETAVNESVIASETLQRTVEEIGRSIASSGLWQHTLLS